MSSRDFSNSDASRRAVDEEDNEDEDDDVSSGDELEVTPRKPVPMVRRAEGGAARRSTGGGEAAGGDGGGDGIAKLPIQIRTMDGKTYKIDAKTDWDVQRLKQEFERWHGGNAAMCSLYYKAKKLQDNNTLQSYKIGAGDFVMANYRSVGGLSPCFH